jgi:hypothetical protein
MTAGKLVTVVSYCSNERSYIDALLQNALTFSEGVYVSVGARLYTGEPEHADHLTSLQKRHPSVRFIWYAVEPDELADPIPLHNKARQVGVSAAVAEHGSDVWVLLIDGDEVPEGQRVLEWWSHARSILQKDMVLKLANYWLFLDPRLVAEQIEDSVLIAHASVLTDRALGDRRERDGIYSPDSEGPHEPVRLMRRVHGLDGKPMFWHFSWVRPSREALKAKCKNWGHKNDKDWAALIDAAFDGIEAGRWPATDFVHGYRLRVMPTPGHGWVPST